MGSYRFKVYIVGYYTINHIIMVYFCIDGKDYYLVNSAKFIGKFFKIMSKYDKYLMETPNILEKVIDKENIEQTRKLWDDLVKVGFRRNNLMEGIDNKTFSDDYSLYMIRDKKSKQFASNKSWNHIRHLKAHITQSAKINKKYRNCEIVEFKEVDSKDL